MVTADGVEFWNMSSEKYCKSAVQTVELILNVHDRILPSKCRSPLRLVYRSELYTTPELKSDGVQKYQELIGVLRWAIYIGRVDILLEVSLMSTHLALQRIVHLENLYYVFGFLNKKLKMRLVFDPAHTQISENMSQQYDWQDFYRDATEAIPGDMPEPRGNSMSTHCFFYADLSGNTVTRQSQTGIIIFCNRAPIIWHSKRQNIVETCIFGGDFTSTKNDVELSGAL